MRFAACCAIGLLAAWLPYVLTLAPGNVHGDSLESITQMLKHGHPTTSHHPVFFTLLIGVFLKIGTILFGTVNSAVLFYNVFQMLLMIATIVIMLSYMHHLRAKRWILFAALLYFMFLPIFPTYAVTVWKDIIYSCMLLFLSLLLFEIVTVEYVRGVWFICFFAVGLGVMCARNNGLYAFAGVTVICVLGLRRYAKRLLPACVAAIAVYMAMNMAAIRVWNIHGDFVENLGIPLQQVAYTINNDGEFSEEDTEYLHALLPDHVWGYAYRPCLVDTIKWNPYFNMPLLNEQKPRFFKIWFNGLCDNFDEYVEAYLLATFGFWKPGVQNIYGYMETIISENDYGIEHMHLDEKLLGVSLMPYLGDNQIYIGSGTLLWLSLFGMILAVLRRRGAAMPYVPMLMNLLTVLIATPVAFSLRYVFVLALGIPFYLMVPFLLRSRMRTRENQ